MLRSKFGNIWRSFLSISDVALNKQRAKWTEASQQHGCLTAFWTRWHSSGPRDIKNTNRQYREQSAPDEQRGNERRRMNSQITSDPVRLVSDTGSKIVPIAEALQLAQEANRDLVEVAAHAKPPVVKIVDMAQQRAEQFAKLKQRREKEIKRRRLETLKEIRLKAGSDEGALSLKANMCSRVLKKGHKVKFVYYLPKIDQRIKSKQTKSPKEKLEEIINLVGNTAEVESPIRMAAHKTQLHVILRPSKDVLDELEHGRTLESEGVDGSSDEDED